MAERDSILISRRQRVGWIAVTCLTAASIGFAAQGYESAWASMASRIGIVLGSLWMCLPTETRPAAWSAMTPGRLALVVVAAVLSYRVSVRYLPFLVAAGFLGWLLRPKKKQR